MGIRVVLDTNVLVSAFLNPRGAPASVVAAALGGQLEVFYDGRILAEYVEVLHRPEFGIAAGDADAVIRRLRAKGLAVLPHPIAVDLPDPDDRVFLEIAEAVDAWVVTGNLKHFPGVRRAIGPRAFLDMMVPTND